MLSPERDEQLEEMTERRITTFAHDLVPDYLRTKLEPLAENKMMQLEHKAATLTFENAQKQVAAYQKVISHIWDIVSKAREEWEVEATARGNTQQNSSVADTHLLVTAVGMGKGLKVIFVYLFDELFKSRSYISDDAKSEWAARSGKSRDDGGATW